MDDLEVPPFMETPMSIDHNINHNFNNRCCCCEKPSNPQKPLRSPASNRQKCDVAKKQMIFQHGFSLIRAKPSNYSVFRDYILLPLPEGRFLGSARVGYSVEPGTMFQCER